MTSGVISTNPDNQAYLDALNLYASELGKAKDEKGRRAAGDKFYKSLRAQKVNEKLISASAEFFASIVGNELEGAKMLYAATSKQVDHVQNLQKDQSSLLMNMLAQTQQPSIGIIGFVKALSMVCRMVGADSFADSLDQKAKEEEAKIHVNLDTRNITDGSSTIHQKMAEVKRTLQKSTVVDDAGRKATQETGATLTNPTAPFVPEASGAAGKAAEASTWTAYRQAMRETGLSDDDVKKIIMPLWLRSAALLGDKTRLDGQVEADSFITALKDNSTNLTAEKKALAERAAKKVMAIASKGPIAEKAEAGPV